ncbi:MAG: hypothetical protein K9L17_04320 [Clostridiales bacterium]|nr:hypothetical protein [Clostridiales bacterium]MCF8021905.1 hypothetical protein [Clostridiales bacterium]
MINTSERSELQNCIRNAQECMMEMGQMIDISDMDKNNLMRICTKTGILLEEAQQRCETIM